MNIKWTSCILILIANHSCSFMVTSHIMRFSQRSPLKANPWPNILVFFHSLSPTFRPSGSSVLTVKFKIFIWASAVVPGFGITHPYVYSDTSRLEEITDFNWIMPSMRMCVSPYALSFMLFNHLTVTNLNQAKNN